MDTWNNTPNNFHSYDLENDAASSKKKIVLTCIVIAIVLIAAFFWITSTKSILFSEHNIVLTIGDSYTLSAEINPSYALFSDFEYLTSDDSIINIDGTQITALSAGTAIVTAVQNGKTYDKCSVVVQHLQPKKMLFSDISEIYIGRKHDLSVSFVPANSTDTALLYQVSDENIASIENNSIIGHQAGTVTVTAVHQTTGISCEETVTVVPVVAESIEIKCEQNVFVGATLQPQIVFSPTDVTDKNIKWTSSNSSVVFVDGDSIIANSVGTAVLTANHSSGIKAELSITVNPVMPKTVRLNCDTGRNLIVGDTATISVSVLPENTTDKTVQWASSDSKIATVNKNGKVTAKAPGVVQITATSCNDISSRIEFTINPKPVNQKNGLVKKPSEYCEAPVTIHAPKDHACYVYFDSYSGSGNDFSIFASAGSTVDVKAPLGSYKLYYATGDTWYGAKYRFGVGTSYYSTNEYFSFYTSGNYVYGTELTLYSVVNGNMSTYTISEDEFPE